MAPRRFRQLLKRPFANRNRSHSHVLDAHDSDPVAAETASAASNPTGNPAPAAVEATAAASSSSSPAYVIDPEMARKYMKNIKRFRILVMGRANAGKTTLLQRVCNTVDNAEIFDGKGNKVDGTVVRGTLERGHHNIEDELVFQSNPGFVFHDSCGFEAGSVKEFNEMKSFVVGRAVTGSLKNRIHAIWYCIPMTDYQRTVTAAEQKFFEECDTGHVPVIVILTKTDTLNLLAIEELLDDGNFGVEITEEKAAEREKELLEKGSTRIKEILSKSKFPPKQYVSVQKMNEQTADCSALMHCTTDALDERGLQRVLVSTQQSSIALCVEYAVKKTLKSNMELGIKDRLMVNVKDMERDLLNWFPNKYDQQWLLQHQRRQLELLQHQRRQLEWEREQEDEQWEQEEWQQLQEEREQQPAQQERQREQQQQELEQREHEWEQGGREQWLQHLQEGPLELRLRELLELEHQWEQEQQQRQKRGDHLYELSSLAVVDNYSTMLTLPQNTTLFGKFMAVKSMVCHAVVCLLAFEHSYFLMQKGSCHSWNEALVLSVNKYNASHIQQNVTEAVNVAFQQYGDNVAELCDEILKIITENKMAM